MEFDCIVLGERKAIKNEHPLTNLWIDKSKV